MESRQPISITILQQALEEKRAEIRALERDAEELQRAIRQLLGQGSELQPEQAFALIIDDQTAAAIVGQQVEEVENDDKYPAELFKGMQRIEIAIALARGFEGYLATTAFRKVLSRPGILKSTSQVGSVASRVLSHSEAFERVWEGLYRLRNYELRANKIPVQAAIQ